MGKRLALLCFFALAITGCGSSKNAASGSFSSYDKSAKACFYADKYNGKKTANGEIPLATASLLQPIKNSLLAPVLK